MKSCPRCRALAFDDLPTCYNCLYPFELPAPHEAPDADPDSDIPSGGGGFVAGMMDLLEPDEPDEPDGPAAPMASDNSPAPVDSDVLDGSLAPVDSVTSGGPAGSTGRAGSAASDGSVEALPQTTVGEAQALPSFIVRVQRNGAARPYGVLLGEGQVLQVGRSKACDIILDAPDISRRHALVRLEAGEVWVDDLGSHNGTFLNGRRLDHAERMEPGDQVSIGKVRLGIEKVDVR